jgi:hypothetical protein
MRWALFLDEAVWISVRQPFTISAMSDLPMTPSLPLRPMARSLTRPRGDVIVSRLRDDQAAARERADQTTTPGRCGNLDYCSVGLQRVLVKVPVDRPFVCPECGNALHPPDDGESPWVMPAVRIGILVVGIGLGFAQGYLTGRLHVGAAPAFRTEPSAAPREPAADVARMQEPPPRAADLPRPLPLVASRAYPAHPAPLDVDDPPAHLQQEQRFGQVTLDCSLDVSADRPSCRVGSVRGGDAFSALALAWLQSLEVRYAAGARAGVPALLDHRWRVVFEDYSGTDPAR